MANVDALLQRRYGQARFNPRGGQTQMGMREWLDLHPALQNMDQAGLEQRYGAATGQQGGQNWQQSRSFGTPGAWQTFQGPAQGTADRMKNIEAENVPHVGTGPLPTGAAPAAGSVEEQMGGPDKPPAQRNQTGEQSGMGGGDGPKKQNYKSYLKTQGKSSTAEVGAAYRRSQGKGMTDAQKKKLGKKSEH